MRGRSPVRSMAVGPEGAPEKARRGAARQGRGRRRRTSRPTAVVTRTPVPATFAVARITSPTGPPRFPGGSPADGSGGGCGGRVPWPVRLGGREVRAAAAGFAAAEPLRSARAAACPDAVPGRWLRAPAAAPPALPERFSLRRPGRDRGRFSRTPPSSVMAHECTRRGLLATDRVPTMVVSGKNFSVDWRDPRHSAFRRLTSLSIALLLTRSEYWAGRPCARPCSPRGKECP
jgi:hypothetical protein